MDEDERIRYYGVIFTLGIGFLASLSVLLYKAYLNFEVSRQGRISRAYVYEDMGLKGRHHKFNLKFVSGPDTLYRTFVDKQNTVVLKDSVSIYTVGTGGSAGLIDDLEFNFSDFILLVFCSVTFLLLLLVIVKPKVLSLISDNYLARH